MRYRGFSWKLIVANALLLALVLMCGALLLAEQLSHRANDAALAQLSTDAALWTAFLGLDLDPARVQSRLNAAAPADGRIAVLASDGGVIAARGAGSVDEIQNQPEIEFARRTGQRASGRHTIGARTYNVIAMPITRGQAPPPVVWIARPTWTWHEAPTAIPELLLLVVTVAVFSSLVLSLLVSRFWRRPLRRLAEHAARMSQLQVAAPRAERGDEFSTLTRSLDDLQERWEAQTKEAARRRVTLEALLSQIQEGVIAARADGRLMLINPTALRLLQLDVSPFTAEKCERLADQAIERCIPQHDVLEMLQLPRSSGETRDGGVSTSPPHDEARVQIDTPDGVRHIRVRGANLRLPAGDDGRDTGIGGRVVVLSDVTEFVRTAQVKTDFVANASHELRTPISSIRASVEALHTLNLATEHDSAERFIGAIDRQSSRLAAMVSDLLDLARIESPATTYQPKQLVWSQVARDQADRHAERAAQKSIQLKFTEAPAGPNGSFSVAPYLLNLVLNNLIENALKFTPAGGRVEVSFAGNGDAIRLRVADTGCGIHPDDRDRVFERFYQVERARSGTERGTGLGLSIVRHAVSAMQGTITLESTLGVGTCFTVMLPRDAGLVTTIDTKNA